MKCALCDRELSQAAHWVGGLAIGPVCFKKRFGTVTKLKYEVIKNEQPDLFTMTKNPQTAEFEAWARKQMRYPVANPDFALNDIGDYKNHYVQADWETWQGARANVQTESASHGFYELRKLRKKPFESELLGTFQNIEQAEKGQDSWRKDLPSACFRIDYIQRTVISISGIEP
jgi:hypothetical protein